MALTLLHTADWHLGRRFPAFERDQEQQLTRARLDAVGRILDLAESRNVAAVLCAGDLFDDPSPDEPWWGGVLREFVRRDWTRPVILLPGNHDPLTPNSLYDPSHPFRAGLPGVCPRRGPQGLGTVRGRRGRGGRRPCTSRAGQTDLAASLRRSARRATSAFGSGLHTARPSTSRVTRRTSPSPAEPPWTVVSTTSRSATRTRFGRSNRKPRRPPCIRRAGSHQLRRTRHRQRRPRVLSARSTPARHGPTGSPWDAWTSREETCTSLAALSVLLRGPEPASHRAAPRPRHGGADGRVRRGGATARRAVPAPWRRARAWVC